MRSNDPTNHDYKQVIYKRKKWSIITISLLLFYSEQVHHIMPNTCVAFSSDNTSLDDEVPIPLLPEYDQPESDMTEILNDSEHDVDEGGETIMY